MPRKYTRKPKEGEENDALAAVASIEQTSSSDVQKLLDEIAGLKEKLAVSETARGAAETSALEQAQAQGVMMQSGIVEVPTGKKIKVARLDRYETVSYKDDGRPILKPKFRQEEVPTFFYKIDLPPVGGLGLTINGMPLYHNTVYEFDLDTLRTVKDMVYKCWKHDSDIHGSDENQYRKPTNTTLSMRATRGA